jgi:very-short-patch-repair endonuclease
VPHIITGQTVSDTKRELLRSLRREMTAQESLLWSRLRANRLRGLHFRRQQLIHGFVAGFYCHAAGVVVEVDGGIHDQQVDADATRDAALTALGLLVIRFRNEEVNGNLDAVLEAIATASTARITQPGSSAIPKKG